MVKFIFSLVLFSFFSVHTMAQETREELERKRVQLKKEMEQTEKMLNANKAKTKENLVQWKLINDKVNLQDRIIDNISRDINLLNNNIFTLQRDINRFDRLLDTLKQEYAKSMVYAYKNRNNYDFLNFIFSAASFNDAIRRITYLKNYRTYRERQGENISRTQELRRQRIEELGGAKQKKNVVLKSKDKEMAALATQKLEKDRIMNELKKQGKQLNTQLSAYKKQAVKINRAINAAIKKAQADAAKAAVKKAKDDENARAALEKANPNPTNPTTKAVTTAPKRTEPKKGPESILLNADNIALNMSFEKNRGSLPWPVDKGVTIMHYGRNQLPSGTVMDITGLSVATDIGTNVKAVFDGVVSNIVFVEDMQVIIIQHGKYFSTYSNLGSVTVQRGQNVKTGQVIGKAAANLDGIGAIDFYINDEKNNLDPERWLRSR
ncbi:MAG TPA: peptidoglycan DD-metalloendopeptidase family protein [Ferruginibacter sp.]|nr:peptidoglycan DD-metalloendopeptidase family protein [Ferruginibacter sp.]